MQMITERVMKMLQLQGVIHQRSSGKIMHIELCGLFVYHENCWLAGSPDAIVHDSSELNH